MTVSIILLCRDGWEDTEPCLGSLRRSTPAGTYELLAYDNGSSDGSAEKLELLGRDWPELRVFRSGENPSFAVAVNRGMREARGDFLLWLNNDTLLSPGWLDGLLSAAPSDPSIAAVGPMTDHMAPPEQIDAPSGTRASAQAQDAAFLGGFCFLLKRAAMDRVGLLDERFVWGWEDMDYCLRLRQAGLRLALARDVFVRHLGNRSIGRLPTGFRVRTDLSNRRLLLRKWLWTDRSRGEIRDLFTRTGAPWDKYRPRFSVLVPCRGPWTRVSRCLDSVRAGSAPGSYEVLAADCSPGRGNAPRLRELAQSWPELWVMDVMGNASLSRCVNQAAKDAQGDFLVVLDDEALVSPGYLEGLSAAAEPGVGMVGPRSGPEAASGPAPFLSGVAVLIPRPVLEKVGGFDERFVWGCEVADYCLRASQAGYGIRVAEGAFVTREDGDGPEGEEARGLRRENARLLFEKWAGHPCFLEQRC